MKRIIFCLINIIFLASSTFAQSENKVPYDAEKMQWFEKAKLGIFIHWGIYSVNGIGESWSFYNKEISYEDYMKQINGFTANKFDANQWASLFKQAGAKYAVLTAKHHDGVALWDTKWSDLNVVKKSPAKRDVLAEYVAAMKKEGLKTGIYFSHLDWSQPDYPSMNSAGMLNDPMEKRSRFSYPQDGVNHPERWERFLKFHRGQLKELSLNYHPDLLWFDGTWERDEQDWNMKELRDSLLKWKPGVILNSRMLGYGDYDTPEQAIPITKPAGMWEYCMTINNSWGYQPQDKNFKTSRQIIRTFAECLGMGGNLLLDIGPKADGTIPIEEQNVLKDLGAWIKRNEAAVYQTQAGLLPGHCYAPSTLTADKKTLFIYLFDQPIESIPLKGIRNKIKQIKVLSTGEILTSKRLPGASWLNIPGVLLISPPKKLDSKLTVLQVDFEGEIDVYRGQGGAIEKN